MNEIFDLEIDGNSYDIRYFYDCDTGEGGIDIKRSEDGALIGEMMGVGFPDVNDMHDMESFKEKLTEWLDNNI